MRDKMNELPNDTLAKQEMPNFRRSSSLIVGRPYGARVAHITVFDACAYLCGRKHCYGEHFYLYTRGDKTCKQCLRKYRETYQ